MVRKLVLRPSIGNVFSGVHTNSIQGVGRPLSTLSIQRPHEADDGDSLIPSMDVLSELSTLNASLENARAQITAAEADAREAKVQAQKAADNAANAANLQGAAIIADQKQPPPGKNQVWFKLNQKNQVERIYNSIEVEGKWYWTDYSLVASQIIVPGSVGPVLIEDGAVTASKITADESFVDKIITKELLFGKITGDMITADEALMNKLVANNVWAGEVTAKRANSIEINSSTITGSTVQTSARRARTVMDRGGISVYNDSEQQILTLDHGLNTGLAVRYNGSMIPLSDMVFGTEVYSGQGWVPGPPTREDVYGDWREIKLGTMRFPSKNASIIRSVESAVPEASYYFDTVIRFKRKNQNGAIADVMRHTVRPGASNIGIEKASVNTDVDVDVYLVVRAARWFSNNPRPSWPVPQVKWNMEIKPI